jgi:predicted HTH transcriptional regulator
LIHEQQDGYYAALNASNTEGESTIFVTFMLQIIRDALADIIKTQNSHQNVGTNVGLNVGTNEEKVLALLRQDGRLTAKVLASTLGLTERQVERLVASLKKQGVLIRHGASKNGFWEVVDKT